MYVKPMIYVIDNAPLVDWLNFFASMAIAIIAIFAATWSDVWKHKFLKPKLRFNDVPKIPQTALVEIPEYNTRHQLIGKEIEEQGYSMHRIMVKNIGSAPASDIRASIISINSELPLPIPLNWTHIDRHTRNISVNEPVYLDIIQEYDEEFNIYGWPRHLINLPGYRLSKTEVSKITIGFYESSRALERVELAFNPQTREVVVIK